MADIPIRLEGDFGGWTTISDVVIDAGIRATRGILGNRPDDLVANPGTLEFVLRNDKGCSGGVAGYYSPGHANVRAGWGFGAQVRLVANDGATDRVLWRGRVRTIRPTPGKEGAPRVEVLAQDLIADITETTIRAVDPQINQTDVDLLIYLNTNTPSGFGFGSTTINIEGVAIDSYPFAFAEFMDGVSTHTGFGRVVRSTFGLLFVTPDAEFYFISRANLASRVSSGTFTDSELLDIEVPTSLAETYNMVRVTTHPRSLDASATNVLYAAPSVIELNPRETRILWGAYSETASSKKLIGGTDFQTFTAGTDYVGNAAEDGSGSVVTSDVSGSASPYASSVKFTLTNNSYNTVYLTTLQIRGRGIHDDGPITSEASSGTAERPIEIDMPYQNDPNVGQALATFLLSKFGGFTPRALTFSPHKSTTLRTHALERRIGDVITVSETMTGVSSVDCMIQAIIHEVGPGSILRTEFRLRPALTTRAFILDSPTLGVLDTSVLGWA